MTIALPPLKFEPLIVIAVVVEDELLMIGTAANAELPNKVKKTAASFVVRNIQTSVFVFVWRSVGCRRTRTFADTGTTLGTPARHCEAHA